MYRFRVQRCRANTWTMFGKRLSSTVVEVGNVPVAGTMKPRGRKGPIPRLGSQIIPAARIAIRKFGIRRPLVRVRGKWIAGRWKSTAVICSYHLLLDWWVMRGAQFISHWTDNAGFRRLEQNAWMLFRSNFHPFKIFSFVSQFRFHSFIYFPSKYFRSLVINLAEIWHETLSRK